MIIINVQQVFEFTWQYCLGYAFTSYYISRVRDPSGREEKKKKQEKEEKRRREEEKPMNMSRRFKHSINVNVWHKQQSVANGR